MRYQGDRSFHFWEKRQFRRLRLTCEADRLRQLPFLQTAAKIGNLVREAQAPVAILHTQSDRLSGTNNTKAAREIHQMAHERDSYIHLCAERRRITGAEQQSSDSRSANSRI